MTRVTVEKGSTMNKKKGYIFITIITIIILFILFYQFGSDHIREILEDIIFIVGVITLSSVFIFVAIISPENGQQNETHSKSGQLIKSGNDYMYEHNGAWYKNGRMVSHDVNGMLRGHGSEYVHNVHGILYGPRKMMPKGHVQLTAHKIGDMYRRSDGLYYTNIHGTVRRSDGKQWMHVNSEHDFEMIVMNDLLEK